MARTRRKVSFIRGRSEVGDDYGDGRVGGHDVCEFLPPEALNRYGRFKITVEFTPLKEPAPKKGARRGATRGRIGSSPLR